MQCAEIHAVINAVELIGPLLHAGEPCGHAVVVVLRPAIERMVVALSALDLDPEK